MKKIIFSDIDKTLCQKKEISEVTKKTINDYINSGGIFVLVSGRGVKYTKMKTKGNIYAVLNFDYVLPFKHYMEDNND